MTQENRFTSFTTYRFTSFTTCGMPKAHIKNTTLLKDVIGIFYSNGIADRIRTKDGASYSRDVFELLYPIGATSSDDPPQKLYVEDLIEFWFKDLEKPTVGLLIWYEYGVMVKYKIHPSESTCSYQRFYAVQYHAELIRKKPIKKLTSRHTKEGKEILKKAGLE